MDEDQLEKLRGLVAQAQDDLELHYPALQNVLNGEVMDRLESALDRMREIASLLGP